MTDQPPGSRWRSGDGCGILAAMIELQVLTPDDWQGPGDREERWRSRLSIPGSPNVIALLDGQPAGMVSGVPGRLEPLS